MKKLRLGKTFLTPVRGVPDRQMIPLEDSGTRALVVPDLPGSRFKLQVSEGDRVHVGMPLLTEKADSEICLTSPAGGRVAAVRRGARRALQEIVIETASDAPEAVSFDPMDQGAVEKMPREALTALLKKRGVWPFLRQFPYQSMARGSDPFPLAIVSLSSTDPFAPHPGSFLEDHVADFFMGLSVLGRLAEAVVVTVNHSAVKEMASLGLDSAITHVTEDRYPAGDPGVILYQIRQGPEQNNAVTMDPQALVAMGHLVRTGRYLLTRIYTLGGSTEKTAAHYQTVLGAPVSFLTGRLSPEKGILIGGLFTGGFTDPDAHLGEAAASAVVLDKRDRDLFFGFVWPGLNAFSESRTFLSSLGRWAQVPDATLHGEERACVNCGWCDKKCPVDLLPQFIMKTVGAGEMEEALSMGLLDCTGCGLCSFVCPSKIDLAGILTMAAEVWQKEKETV